MKESGEYLNFLILLVCNQDLCAFSLAVESGGMKSNRSCTRAIIVLSTFWIGIIDEKSINSLTVFIWPGVKA